MGRTAAATRTAATAFNFHNRLLVVFRTVALGLWDHAQFCLRGLLGLERFVRILPLAVTILTARLGEHLVDVVDIDASCRCLLGDTCGLEGSRCSPGNAFGQGGLCKREWSGLLTGRFAHRILLDGLCLNRLAARPALAALFGSSRGRGLLGGGLSRRGFLQLPGLSLLLAEIGPFAAGGLLSGRLVSLLGLFGLGLALGGCSALGARRAATVFASVRTGASAGPGPALFALGLDSGFLLLGLLFCFRAEKVLEEIDGRIDDGVRLGRSLGLGLRLLLGGLLLHRFLVRGSHIGRQNALDHRNLLGPQRLFFLGLECVRIVGNRREILCAVVAGDLVVKAGVIGAQTLDVVMGRLKERVGDEHDRHAVAGFELGNFASLFVEKERGDIDRNLGVQCTRAFLGGFLLQNAQHLQGAGFGVADDADAVAARAGDVVAFGERGTQSLARELEQAEAADLADLHPGAVRTDRLLHVLLDRALILGLGHVDEVDDDESAKVSQTHLAGHFLGSFQIGAKSGFLNVGSPGCACRVHVHGNQCFGVVDHDRAAGGQGNRPRIGGFDLMLDLEAGKEGRVLAVALHAVHHVGHHVRHELAGLIVDGVGVDEDFSDVGLEVVADGADDEVAFLNNQEGGRVGAAQLLAIPLGIGRVVRDRAAVFLSVVFILGRGGLADRFPELEKIVEVPLQLFGRPSDASRAGDDAHAGRKIERVHGLAQFLPVLAFDSAAHAASAGVVRHQHEIASGQADEGREGGSLVAALFLFNLNDDFLALAERFLDGRRADIDAVPEVAAGDFLERQKAVALLAVVNETGLEGRFNAGDDALVDVGFALFATGTFNVDVDQPLSVNDANASFFGVDRIK